MVLSQEVGTASTIHVAVTIYAVTSVLNNERTWKPCCDPSATIGREEVGTALIVAVTKQ